MEKRLTQREVADVLEQIGLLLELKGENPFKSRAYINAARIILNLEDDLEALVNAEALSSIRGIGKALSSKISTLMTTGTLPYFDDLKAGVPKDHLIMLRIQGLGPKKIIQLHEALQINTLEELESACKSDRLLNVHGFGEKIQAKILRGIEQLRTREGLYLYAAANAELESLLFNLQRNSGMATSLSAAGSLRRKCPVVRNIDLIAVSDQAEQLSALFTALPQSRSVLEKENSNVNILLASGMQAHLRIVRNEHFPFALRHFTGSKDHNAALQRHCLRLGMTMNECGILKSTDAPACRDEEEIYAALGLSFIPPELREDTGEIEAAENGRLPRLIEASDLRGIFHIHTSFSDGKDTIESIAATARQIGLEYIGISDHSRSAFYAKGLSEESIKKQIEKIDRINADHAGPYIFKGIEIEILPNGRLDYDENILGLFDFVIAAIHSHFSMSEPEMTDRVCRALDHPSVTMLAHPTGRLLLAREPYAIDLEKVIERASALEKIIELNAHPDRLDLDWRWCKVAKKRNVKISINPDAHTASGLSDIRCGIDQARKGWLEASDCFNTLPLEEMKKFLRSKRRA